MIRKNRGILAIMLACCMLVGCASGSAVQESTAQMEETSVDSQSAVMEEDSSDIEVETVDGVSSDVAAGEEEVQTTENSTEEDSTSDNEETGDNTKTPPVSGKLTVWNAYWDMGTVPAEMAAMSGDIANVCFFSAYFDPNSQVFLPDETALYAAQNLPSFYQKGYHNYMTVVNDQRLADGSSLLKDTKLLYRVMETPQSRAQYIASIVKLAKDHSFDGIELDFENIKKDMTLWSYYISFISEMKQAADKEGMRLRVLLEPNMPLDQISWVNGPTYVMMCYNLYGYHSGPGPKCDNTFLAGLVDRMSALPGNKEFALATGGFVWTNGASPKALNEMEAVALAGAHGVQATRDAASGDMVFKYTENGSSCEAWYADKTTLNQYRAYIRSRGDYGVAIWRLGGNIVP